MLRVSLLLSTWLLFLPAADLPLGVVEAVGDAGIAVRFDAGAVLEPADMVAIYGPGKVEKHPLTQEVIREERQLVAKAQLLEAREPGQWTARITWLAEGVQLAPGFDAVPLPGEASPDAPPVLGAAGLPTVEATAQATVRIALPIADPEQGPVICRWRLAGPTGRRGRLSALSTGTPAVEWLAPSLPDPDLALEVEVADAAGQAQTWTLPLGVAELGEQWRRRQLGLFATLGVGADGAWSFLDRAPDGHWWAIADGRQLVSIQAGWTTQGAFTPQEGVSLRSPLAVQQVGQELFVLDAGARQVLVLAPDGVLRRSLGAFRTPTDLMVAADGAIMVADQGLGGVMVLEADGRVRCRLGQADGGDDAFQALERIAGDGRGRLFCLDTRGQRIHVFDRQHRRGPIWGIQTTADKPPVDIAWHPSGLLVLLADGSVQVFDAEGLATRSLAPLAEKAWLDRLSAPSSISVDLAGETYVSYPREGVVARYARDGTFIGARGGALWAVDQIAVDGDGTTYGLGVRDGLIRIYDSEGWQRQRFGGLERYDGPFQTPGAMAVSADGRWLCVLDTRRLCVLRFDLQRPLDRPLVFGQPGTNNGQFRAVETLACDETGRVYVVDPSLHRVSVFGVEDGAFAFTFGRYERGRAKDELTSPALIAVDSGGTTAWIYDSRLYEVQKFTLDHGAGTATHVTNGGGRGRDLGQFSRPIGLGCDRLGLLYLLDSGNRNLQVVDFRGSNAVAISAVDLREACGLSSPTGLGLGPDGRPWVIERGTLHGLHWK